MRDAAPRGDTCCHPTSILVLECIVEEPLPAAAGNCFLASDSWALAALSALLALSTAFSSDANGLGGGGSVVVVTGGREVLLEGMLGEARKKGGWTQQLVPP